MRSIPAPTAPAAGPHSSTTVGKSGVSGIIRPPFRVVPEVDQEASNVSGRALGAGGQLVLHSPLPSFFCGQV
jgi:hypothetical protein